MATAAPTPRRMTRPRWLNVRVIGGIVLVVAAVVLGAKVIGSSNRTSPVWSASRDLAAGTVLGVDDLVPVELNLGEQAARYLTPASPSPAGQTLLNPMRAGELVAVSGVQPQQEGRIVVVGVTPDRMPPGVGHGSVIDLYLTTGGGPGSAGEATTDLIEEGATVQSVSAPATGGLSGAASNRFQVSMLLTADDADRLVRTLPRGEPIVVLITGSR